MNQPRPDLSALRGLSDLAASLRPEGFADQLRERAETLEKVRERVRGLQGRAESDDGLLVATYSGEGGLDGLTLDPKAMRLPSVDLAAAILDVARAARLDYEQQRREVAAEAGATTPVDPAEAERAVREVNAAAAEGLSEIQTMVDRLRSRLG